jgi:hypothetical protein
LADGATLTVGGTFTNSMDDADTEWTNTTLRLTSGIAYTINPKTTGETYGTIEVAAGTQARLWNATSTGVVTESGSSLYSMDHEGENGELYIFW